LESALEVAGLRARGQINIRKEVSILVNRVGAHATHKSAHTRKKDYSGDMPTNGLGSKHVVQSI